jgi:endonuclease/exonuclease/phosphatase (EEP) superfamily protein YafD
MSIEIFEQTTPQTRWIERFISFLLLLGIALCIYQPEIGVIKKWAQYAPQIAISYWVMGLVFLILRRSRLTFVSFSACGLLCIFLRETTNKNLANPKPTTEPKLSIAQFNLSASNSSYAQTVSLIRQANSDVLSLQEVTPEWQQWLKDSLHKMYPFRCQAATVNLYNIELYSKFPFITCDTFYAQGVPNLLVSIKAKNSTRKTFVVSHYIMPPLWNAAYKTLQNQLHDMAMHLNTLKEPYITVGAYNMEASSFEIQQFRREAVLLDSRRGFKPMRNNGAIDFSDVPTEHIFYTPHFQCLDFQSISGSNQEQIGIVGTYQFNVDSTNVSKTN